MLPVNSVKTVNVTEGATDWIITIPKTITWDSYMMEVAIAQRNECVLSYRLPQRVKAKPGDRCFVTYKGVVYGWMEVIKVEYYDEGFVCQYSGKNWRPGWYLVRNPNFHSIHNPQKPVLMESFRGIRRYHAER